MIRYFFVGETFGKLLSYEIEREEGSSRNSYLVDIVDSPITFEIKAESDRYRATSCTRENGGNWDDFRMEDSVSEFFYGTSANGEGMENSKRVHLAVLAAALHLDAYLEKTEFWNDNDKPDVETGGVLVEDDGDGFSVKVVTGKERPDMMAYTGPALVSGGDPVMCRPYHDEAMASISEKMGLSSASENTSESISDTTEKSEEEASETSNIGRPNFFCSIDALNTILNKEYDEEGYCDMEISMDLIELPLYFIYSYDEENWILKAYQRGDLYSHDGRGISKGEVIFNKKTKQGQVKATQEIGENMGAFYAACKKLSYYAQDEKLDEVCAEINPEEAGILLDVEDGELKYKLVRGKERPEMMCETLFGGTVMGRPYFEDFMERSAREMMSVEDKTELAEAGDVECMEELFKLYANGNDETDANPEKAVYWLEKMADAGNSNGMFNLGLHYAKGHGISRDFEKAAYWMEKAAEAGDEDAVEVAKEYRKIADSVAKAENGDGQAQADLAGGLMRLGGSLDQAGPGKDYEESVMWAKKAAAQSIPDAMWVLGLAYYHGRGVKENKDYGIAYFRRGAELNQPGCLHNLGCEYMTGENIWKNEKKGFEYIKKAAEQGYGLAMRDLGRCYQFGNGCTGNMKKAIEWYEKALEVINDPELEQKVTVFKMLGDSTPDFGEDYSGADNPYDEMKLEGTQYEGRVDRCERLRTGTKLQYRIGKDNHGNETLEILHLGSSVGFIPSYYGENLIKFIRKDKITIDITVKSCIPKSQRGSRARTAEVYMKLEVSDKLPETPEEQEKRLAAEQARKKAEEDRRRAEEEARKKAEAEAAEKAKAFEALKKEYETTIQAWRDECDKVSAQRTEFVESKLRDRTEAVKEELQAKHIQDQERLKTALSELGQKKSQEEQKLGSLGFFKFGEKKATKALIEQISRDYASTESEITSETREYERNIANASSIAEKEKATFETEAAGLFPLPGEPQKPAELIRAEEEAERERRSAAEKEERERRERESEIQRKNEHYKELILMYMDFSNKYTITDIMRLDPELSALSKQTVSALVRQLKDEGKLKREEIQRKAYFSLNW